MLMQTGTQLLLLPTASLCLWQLVHSMLLPRSAPLRLIEYTILGAPSNSLRQEAGRNR